MNKINTVQVTTTLYKGMKKCTAHMHGHMYVYWNTYQLSSHFLSTPPEHTHSLFVDHMFLHSNNCRFLCNCSHRYCQCNLRQENTSSTAIVISTIKFRVSKYPLPLHNCDVPLKSVCVPAHMPIHISPIGQTH